MPAGISSESETHRFRPLPITTVVASVILAGVLLASCSSCTSTNPESQQAAQQQAPLQRSPVQRQSGNVAVELLNLYDEYREFLTDEGHDRGKFRTAQNAIAIIEDRVVIDVTAQGDADRLRQDLADIGAVSVAVAQRLVSCQLPILAIPKLQHLDSLKFARPSYATTR